MKKEDLQLIEIEASPKKIAIFDLDGVVIRWTGAHQINPDDFADAGRELAAFRKEGGGISVLTNRPPGEMQPIAYSLGAKDGIWVTEMGGTAYDVAQNKLIIPERWQPYAFDYVPELRTLLRSETDLDYYPTTFDEPQFIPAMGPIKTVITPPSGVDIAIYANEVIIPVLQTSSLADRFIVAVGKGIDIDPVGLTKASGMELLLDLNGINPRVTPTLFIADHKRDIPAADVLHARGGYVAAVGNSSSEYMGHVQSLRERGIVAPTTTEYHSSVANIMSNFRRI